MRDFSRQGGGRRNLWRLLLLIVLVAAVAIFAPDFIRGFQHGWMSG